MIWRPGVSAHFAPLIRELSKCFLVDLVVGKQPGWGDQRGSGKLVLDHGSARLMYEDDPELPSRVFAGDPKQTLHFAASMNDGTVQRLLEDQLKTTSLRLCVFSEPRPLSLPFGPVRVLQRRLDYFRFYRKAAFALGTGDAGCNFLKLCGYPSRRVHPFGYVTDLNARSILEAANDGNCRDAAKLLFIGQLIVRKGVDLILDALNDPQFKKWSLTIAGKGPEEENLKLKVRELRIESQVTFVGPIESGKVVSLMRSHDMVVVPSRFDGWCSVIPEALQSGVPVVCSRQCGASSVVSTPLLGEVFNASHLADLREKLQLCWQYTQAHSDRSLRIQTFWTRSLSPEVFALYFTRIVEHYFNDRALPHVPWKQPVHE